MRPPIKFQWKGNHHSYYGIFLVVFGLFNYYMGIDNGNLSKLSSMWWSLTGVGVLMIIDDIIEHSITASTPLRKIYEIIFRLK